MAENMSDNTHLPDENFINAYGKWAEGGWGAIFTGEEGRFVSFLVFRDTSRQKSELLAASTYLRILYDNRKCTSRQNLPWQCRRPGNERIQRKRHKDSGSMEKIR
jgi:hypothetical protein